MMEYPQKVELSSEDFFEPNKQYDALRFYHDRWGTHLEMNTLQKIIQHVVRRIGDSIFEDGAILYGLESIPQNNIVLFHSGAIYLSGQVRTVDCGESGISLSFPLEQSTGFNLIYCEMITFLRDHTYDANLINPATLDPTAEAKQSLCFLQDHDTTLEDLPPNGISRVVIPIFKFYRDGRESPLVPIIGQTLKLNLSNMKGFLEGERLAIGSIDENRLRNDIGGKSLLQDIRDRTYHQSGNFVTEEGEGLRSYYSHDSGTELIITTRSGGAYIAGKRFSVQGAFDTFIPKAEDTREIRGEQKTFQETKRRYELNSQPAREITQVEGIKRVKDEVVTRGTIGGADSLQFTPVVDIEKVYSDPGDPDGTAFIEGTDWIQSGNTINWSPGGSEPTSGSTYYVQYTHTYQFIKDQDFRKGGWFGAPGWTNLSGKYWYFIAAKDDTGETEFSTTAVFRQIVSDGDILQLSWQEVINATGYRIYRSIVKPENPTTLDHPEMDFYLLHEIEGGNITSWTDDGVEIPVSGEVPSLSNTTTDQIVMSSISIQVWDQYECSLINFGAVGGYKPVHGSNVSVDYDYYLWRIDLIVAGLNEEGIPCIYRVPGNPSEKHTVQMPQRPTNCAELCYVILPPNTTDITVENVDYTMLNAEEIRSLKKEIETLKYNDALSQMNADLNNRDSIPKKGVYSDDFSTNEQSDFNHPEYSCRIDTTRKFVTVPRETEGILAIVDETASNCQLFSSIATLPIENEEILVSQDDYSKTINVNEFSVFEDLPSEISCTPNVGRQGQSGIVVNGRGFLPSRTNLELSLGGLLIANNIESDSYGRVSYSFLVPENAALGDRNVVVSDGQNSAKADISIVPPQIFTRVIRQNTTATETKSAPGAKKILVNHITRTVIQPVETRVIREVIQVARRDPAAQTICFPKATLLTAIELSFAEKDTSIPVIIQIRGVVAGVPNSTIYAEKVLLPEQVQLNTWTEIRFGDPVLMSAKQYYSIVVMTNSNQYRLHVAEVGGIGQNGPIEEQAFSGGTMLIGADANTWLPEPRCDFRMRVKGVIFKPTGEIIFQPKTDGKYSSIGIDEYSIIPSACRLSNWMYRYRLSPAADWKNWLPISPHEDISIPQLAEGVQIKSVPVTTDSSQSLLLNYKAVGIIVSKNQTSGVYITRAMVLQQDIQSAKIYIQADIPNTSQITVWADSTDGKNWQPCGNPTESRIIDEEWTEYKYEINFVEVGKLPRIKIVFSNVSELVVARVHKIGVTLS